MKGKNSRRQVLRATAGVGLATGVAGCLSTFSEEDGEPASDGESGDGEGAGNEPSGSGDESERSPCDVSRDLLELLIAGDLDEALEYTPYEHDDEIDRADARSYLSDWESTDAGGIELVDDSCETLELDEAEAEREELLDMFGATRVFGRTHEVVVDGEDGSTVHEAEVVVLEIDESWYAIAAGPGTGTVEDVEVSVQIEGDSVVPVDATGADAEVLVSVIDETGEPVPGATVIASADSAKLDGVIDVETGDEAGLEGEYDLMDHQAVLALEGKQDLYRNQDMGTLEIDVIPPSDTNYIDAQPNPELVVISDDSA